MIRANGIEAGKGNNCSKLQNLTFHRDKIDQEINEIISRVFFAYLKTSLYRIARNYIKRESRHRVSIWEDFEPKELENRFPCEDTNITRTKSNYHIHIQNDILAGFIQNLNVRDRDILFYLYYEELTATETAKILGVSQQAISKRRNELLRSFKDEYWDS